MRALPRILIAGTGSGCGKTTLTCALLGALRARGERPAAYKCGPDYIDPLYHRGVLGVESRNLDSFFMTPEALWESLRRGGDGATVGVIEGVMGYYDGLGTGSRTSSAEIAELTRTPVVLVLDGQGRAASIAAELYGFLHYRAEGARIRGVILNRVDERRYAQLAELAEREGVRACGYLPREADLRFESRHLGLVTPAELPHFQEEAARLAELAARTLRLDVILELAREADTPVSENNEPRREERSEEETEETVRVALAWDEAFCFYYIDNIEYLESLGCRILRFSPLRDRALPACDALILPGGYPELHAAELEANVSLREELRERIAGGLPTIAECGGYLYLHRTLRDAEGRSYAMAGVLPAGCYYRGFDRHFGYITARTKRSGLFGAAGTECPAHEFHYFRSEAEDHDLCLEKPDGKTAWTGGVLTERLYAGFPHLYLPGSTAAHAFVQAAREYAHEQAARKNPASQ